jgi:hypothetical protein
MATITFDTHDFVRKMRDAGFDEGEKGDVVDTSSYQFPRFALL